MFLTPAGRPVGIDAELAKPGAHSLDAEAARGKGVGAGPGQWPTLYVSAVDRQDGDRGGDLEHQRHERLARALEGMAGTVGGGDPAADERAAQTEQDREPERHRIGAGQRETGEGADQEAGEHDREQSAEHSDDSPPQREARVRYRVVRPTDRLLTLEILRWRRIIPPMRRLDLPSGTVAFLFTDAEGSTRLLHEARCGGCAAAIADHRGVIREACAAHGGLEWGRRADSFFVAFPTAPAASES